MRLLLVEVLAGLLNACIEQGPVLHYELDILDGQFNDHTSDHRGLGADNLLDVLEENIAYMFLVVGVLRHNAVDDGMASH